MAEIREPIEPFGLFSKDRKKTLFSKIGVVGAGKEGRNIIRLASTAGLEVIFIEVNTERIEYALDRISKGLDSRIENWGLTPGEKKSILGRIKGSLNYDDLKDCDFVIECIRYDKVTGERDTYQRQQAFKKIESVVSPEAIIATNSTTVIISELAAALKHKERCVSLHFPVAHPEARLMEIVKGYYTTDAVYQKILQFAKMIKCDTIDVSESNGLVSMRLTVVLLNEACQMLMEKTARLEDINRLMVVGYGMRTGIFQIADVIGIEKLVSLMEDMFNEYGDMKYKPNPVLWRLYRTRQLGVPTGKGFFLYDENENLIGPNPFLSNNQ
ncbi:MAG: 3-hydroxyacyl-CoA dehydrogenase family protein [Dysgonamonadaceae bacterium]|jgi:3-hydroxybutyryl-CoA dehydrogenase|nr:3-hydroxyacyl-CoA dehydrogenase family protein [Dysgonamonadaceae bacterium]